LGPGRGSRTRVPHPARTERQIGLPLLSFLSFCLVAFLLWLLTLSKTFVFLKLFSVKSFRKTKVLESVKSHSRKATRQKERKERRGSPSFF
jgi:hypothetical protein